MKKNKDAPTVGSNCFKNIKEASEEVSTWPEWKVRNIRLAFSEPTIKLNSENQHQQVIKE